MTGRGSVLTAPSTPSIQPFPPPRPKDPQRGSSASTPAKKTPEPRPPSLVSQGPLPKLDRCCLGCRGRSTALRVLGLSRPQGHLGARFSVPDVAPELPDVCDPPAQAAGEAGRTRGRGWEFSLRADLQLAERHHPGLPALAS